jgi:ribose-phosphate pyrophosphokinase
VTAVVPYLCYARKDRKTKPRDPVTTRYLACLFEAVGVDRVVTLDVHNLAAFQNSFRCRTEHLTALPLFVERLAPMGREEPVVVVSPDIGGAKRARGFAEALERAIEREVPSAFVEKHRSGGVVTGGAFAGDVSDRVALIIDDLISSGGTILRAAHACRELGAREVHAIATHGLFVEGARQRDRRRCVGAGRDHGQRAAVPAGFRYGGRQARRAGQRAAVRRSDPPNR